MFHPQLTNELEIKAWLKDMDIDNYHIHENLTVDVHSSVDISEKNLSYLPLQFGQVNGDFNCSMNELTSLKGSPFIVRGEAYFSENKIKSLNFLPKKVASTLDLAWNTLPNVISLLHLLPFIKSNPSTTIFVSLNTEVKAFHEFSHMMSSHPLDELYLGQLGYEFSNTDKLLQYLENLLQAYEVYEEKLHLQKEIKTQTTEKIIKL